jgi:hypothetical protein
MTWATGTYWGNSSTNIGTYIYPAVTSGSSVGILSTAPYVPTAPREPTALEWLDREVDATCAIARAA